MLEGFRPYRVWVARALVVTLAVGNALAPTAAAAASALSGRTIVVDPGHGGVDSGAVANRLQEKLLTLPIGLDLGADLRGYGARVVFTRTADVTIGPRGNVSAGLATRVALANAVGADAYVSVHANSLADPNFSGLMTFYGQPAGFAGNGTRSNVLVDRGHALAEAVQQSTLQRTGALDQGVHAADYYVLGYTAMPSVLVETGFITNPAEALRLATPSYQRAIASGIAVGVARFFRGAVVAPSAQGSTASGVADTADPGTYTVQAGDTLSEIALRYGVPLVELAQANGIADSNAVVAGRRLRVGSGAALSAAPSSHSATSATASTYAVRPGDTLSGIAARYHRRESDLARLNGLRDPNHLVAGRTLTLPVH